MDSGKIIAIAFMATYLIIVLLVGVWVGRRKATSASWQFGSGGLSVAAIISMLLGTRLGATATVGLVEDVYNTGIVAFSFIAGNVVGSIVCALTTGKLFYRTRMMTLPAFNFRRLGKRVTILGILIDVVIGLAVNGIQVLGVGLIIGALTGLPLVWGIVLGSFLGWIYVTLGGINATAATNIIHLVVCFAGVFGGFAVLLSVMPLSEAIGAMPEDMMRPATPIMTVVRWMIVGVGISVVANVYHSPMATARSERGAVWSSLWTAVLYGVFGAVVTLMGIYAYAWAAPAYEAAKGEKLPGQLAFGVIAAFLGNEKAGGSALGGLMGLVMMAGVVGAIISTMAPLAWAIATILSRDVYRRFINPKATDAEELMATRIFSTVYWLIPGFIALTVDRGLLNALLFLLELPVGGMFAAFLCFYWDRVNSSSAFYTLLTSVSMGIAHATTHHFSPETMERMGPWFGSSVGWIVTSSAVVFILCVMFGPRPNAEQLEVTRRALNNLEPMDDAPGRLIEAAATADRARRAEAAAS